jgi:hypothetical protein
MEKKMISGMNPLNILRLGAFIAADDIEADFLAFVEGLEAGTENGSVMDENILSRVLGDEPEPLFIIEPFDFATGHIFLLRCLSRRASESKKDTGCLLSRCPQKQNFVPPIRE